VSLKKEMPRLLLFGGNGTIGRSIRTKFQAHGWEVIVITRESSQDKNIIQWNPLDENTNIEISTIFEKTSPFDAVCWAQGMNLSDDIYSYDINSHMEMYMANVVYILNSLNILLLSNAIKKPAKFCVLSSIWQNISRQNKLSYSITKSALQGLVLSLSNDLAKDGHLINAVLPGATETPMTRANLSREQISKIENSTQFGRLAALDDVSNSVFSLCSEINTGITGNFVTVDLGFSNVRNI